MSPATETPAEQFVDRRNYGAGQDIPVRERRQFSNSHDGLTPDARDLAIAIDEYKLRHRRRFITFEEMLSVIESLGYTRA
jgi:hypothetical protein